MTKIILTASSFAFLFGCAAFERPPEQRGRDAVTAQLGGSSKVIICEDPEQILRIDPKTSEMRCVYR